MSRIVAETEPLQAAATPIVNPAPLGLSAFALTTFVLSAANAQLFTGESIVIGLALFYGGLVQILAGMWEFKVGNTFGATAFSSYGAFWIAFGASVQMKWIPAPPSQAIAFFLLGWTIFTLIMFLCTFRTNLALILLFGLLTVTFALLTAHAFGGNPSVGQMGGYLGIATALVAWYNALAGLLVSSKAGYTLPVGPRS
jgi:succinate-acetate transporter protein